MDSRNRSQHVPSTSTNSGNKPVSGYPIRWNGEAKQPVQGPSGSRGDVGGVWVPASLAFPVWAALTAEARRVRLSGHEVRPEVLTVLAALRTAALHHMCDSGQAKRTLPHDRASDRLVTTGELAGRLGVTGFHVRRLAAAAGITRVSHGRWAPEDADRLAQSYRRT